MTNLKFGIVSEAKPGYAKVFFAEDNIVTDWWPLVLPTTLKDKVSYPLNVQEHVVCLSDTYLEEGVILGCIHNSIDLPDAGAAPGMFRKVFEDGTILQYDKAAHVLTVNIANGNIILSASSGITITGNITVNGELTADDVKAGTVSLLQHKHTGVQTGGGTSGPPLP